MTESEPGSPDFQYVTMARVGHYAQCDTVEVAFLVRSHLRVLLAPLDALPSWPTNSTPGWRNRVNRTWLSPKLVVVSLPHEKVSKEELDRTWQPPPATGDGR